MTRVRFYIDGFNLYYGALKNTPALRWLDVVALSDHYCPAGEPVDHVRYFTAKVTGLQDPGSPRRQSVYLKALEMRDRLTIHFGQFRTHPKILPLEKPPEKGSKYARVLKTEEKGSDVNLATWLLLDGVDGLYDQAVVVTDDSDLVEPIVEANRRFGPVHVLSPRGADATWAGKPLAMSRAGASWTAIQEADLVPCQLDEEILLPTGRTIHRPPEWT